MKKVLIFSLIFSGLLSCGNASKDRGELVSRIESKSNIGDPSAEEFDPTWVPVKEREAFLTSFFDGVKNGKYEVFEYMPGEFIPMAQEDLQYLLHHVDTEFIEQENGTMELLELDEVYDPSGVVYFKFKEDLYYNKTTGYLSKEVAYVCPMEKVYNEDGSTRGYRGLFWAKLK